MSQVNILIKSSVKPQAEFKGTVIEAGVLAIDAEGQQIKDEKIISGIKLGDGNTVWDNLEYLKLSSVTANSWKTIAERATNSQLVSLPDVNFAYITVSADQLDNATYNKLAEQVISNEIGLTFSLDGSSLVIASNDDKPYLKPMTGSALSGAIIDALTINNDNSIYNGFTVKFQDTITQQKLSEAVETLNTSIAQTKAELEKGIQETSQEIKKSIYSLGDTSTPVGTTSGTVTFPSTDKATIEYFLSGAGSWEKISLVADSVSYTNPNNTTTTVKAALDELINGGAKFSVSQGEPTDKKVYVLGTTNIAGEGSDYTLKYSPSVYIDCYSNVIYGGAWNDIAEFRHSYDNYVGGTCVSTSSVSDSVSLSNKRRAPNSYIVSDTYGFAIGQSEENNCPIAIAGRVLACVEGRVRPGNAVCSSVNGKVCRMRWWEKILYPECIVGYVESIPETQIWGKKQIPINSRVWVRVK